MRNYHLELYGAVARHNLPRPNKSEKSEERRHQIEFTKSHGHFKPIIRPLLFFIFCKFILLSQNCQSTIYGGFCAETGGGGGGGVEAVGCYWDKARDRKEKAHLRNVA